jgi:hypothetical protein
MGSEQIDIAVVEGGRREPCGLWTNWVCIDGTCEARGGHEFALRLGRGAETALQRFIKRTFRGELEIAPVPR